MLGFFYNVFREIVGIFWGSGLGFYVFVTVWNFRAWIYGFWGLVFFRVFQVLGILGFRFRFLGLVFFFSSGGFWFV